MIQVYFRSFIMSEILNLLDQLQELSADGDVLVFPMESLDEDDWGIPILSFYFILKNH